MGNNNSNETEIKVKLEFDQSQIDFDESRFSSKYIFLFFSRIFAV